MLKCKADICCTSCGQHVHKANRSWPRCKHILWVAGCSTHKWYDRAGFSKRQDAVIRFKLHKHDDKSTFAPEVQEALQNLRREGLIGKGYTGE